MTEEEREVFFSPMTLTGVAVSLTEAVRDLDVEAFASLLDDYEPAQLVGGVSELCLNLAVHLAVSQHGVTSEWASDPMAWLSFASDHGPGSDRPEHLFALDFLHQLAQAEIHRTGDPEHPSISVALELDIRGVEPRFLATALARAVLHLLSLIGAASGANAADVLARMRELWLTTL